MGAGDVKDTLLELALAARPLTTAGACPSRRQRVRLADAVIHILQIGRLHGLANAPMPTRDEALEIFKAACAIAASAGVPRAEMVQLFNDDDGVEPARKDLQ